MNLWSRLITRASATPPRAVQVLLYNTLAGKKEVFIPQKPGEVLMYSCGPTVYSQAHVGNLRAYVFSDTIARVLAGAGYQVRRVINITDVGHLVDDGDNGEDKMKVGALREHTTPEAIADRYATLFVDDISALNIETAQIQFPRATAFIAEQIALAKTLEEKGFAYRLRDGLAFDTSRFAGYGKLGHIAVESQRAGARVAADKDKRNPADFWLWRTAKPGDLQQWDSPWGRGNPGWHIECSAMIRALLGIEIDIHTGGEDHIAVHHNNEIAQSEAAHNRTFVRYWMHAAFLTMGGEKASKSLGNVVYLSDLSARGYHPLALRYFFLQAHYRSPLSFTWEGVAAAAAGLERLWRLAHTVATESAGERAASDAQLNFLAVMRDDLATAQALSILWDTLKSDDYTPEEKWGLIEVADAHLGLSLLSPPRERSLTPEEVPAALTALMLAREEARKAKEYAKADEIRAQIAQQGYQVQDGPTGPVLTKTVL